MSVDHGRWDGHIVRHDKVTAGAVALAVLSAVAFVWMFTLDVHVDEPNVDGVPAFCGSAYDVALIKRDGEMGGEPARNQAAIDRACVKEAGVDVAISFGAAVVCLLAAGYAIRRIGDETSVGW